MPASSAQPPSGVLLSHSTLAFNPGKARVHRDHKRIVLTTSSNAPEGPSQPSLSPENARAISTSVIRRRPANQGQPNPPKLCICIVEWFPRPRLLADMGADHPRGLRWRTLG